MSSRPRALLAVVLLATLAVFPPARADHEPFAPTAVTCRDVDEMTANACLRSDVRGCYDLPDGRWACLVEFTLTLRVTTMLTCAEAYSPATPGTPPTLLDCAGLAPTTKVRIVDQEVVRSATGHHVVAGNFVCARPVGSCLLWDHLFQLPARPVEGHGATTAAMAAIRLVVNASPCRQEVVRCDLNVDRGLLDSLLA